MTKNILDVKLIDDGSYTDDPRLATPSPPAAEQFEAELAKLAEQRIGEDAHRIVEEIVKTSDIDRMLTGGALVNAFNFAIQQQAKRDQWTAQDFKAFCVALAAMCDIK